MPFETQRHQSFPQLPELDRMSHFFSPKPNQFVSLQRCQGLGCIGQDLIRWLVTLKSTFSCENPTLASGKLLAAILIMATWHSAETETCFLL